MNKKRWTLTAAVVGVLAVVLLAWNFLKPAPEVWPSMEEAKGPAPSMVVQYDQRDFGWRIGDAIPITVYIKQPAGSTVDVEGMALDGDFELRGEMKVESRKTADGGKIYQVKMSLQSFTVKTDRAARVNLSWNQEGKKGQQEVTQTNIVLHGSRTWDGQTRIQEGRPDFVQGWHFVKVLIIGVGSLAAIVICVVYIRWQILLLPVPKAKPTPVTREQWAQARFDAAWAHIASGDRDPIWFRRITVTMRRYLGAQAILWTQLDNALRNYAYRKQALTVIGLCERVLFKNDVLNEDELMALHTAFHDVVLKR